MSNWTNWCWSLSLLHVWGLSGYHVFAHWKESISEQSTLQRQKHPWDQQCVSGIQWRAGRKGLIATVLGDPHTLLSDSLGSRTYSWLHWRNDQWPPSWRLKSRCREGAFSAPSLGSARSSEKPEDPRCIGSPPLLVPTEKHGHLYTTFPTLPTSKMHIHISFNLLVDSS